MRRLSAYIAIFLLLSTAAPLMACVTGTPMSNEETACCRAMQGKCAEMAPMDCCHKKSVTDNHPQLTTAPPSIDVQWSLCAGTAYPAMPARTLSRITMQKMAEQFPPGWRIAQTTILRI